MKYTYNVCQRYGCLQQESPNRNSQQKPRAMSNSKEQSIAWVRIIEYDRWEEKISTLRGGNQFEVTDRIGHDVVENRCQIRIGRSTAGSNDIRAELRGEPAGYLPDAPIYKGRQDVTRIIGNIMLMHSGFQMRKNFSTNYQQFWHILSKTFATSVLGQKSLKNIGLKGAKLLACQGRPYVSSRPWVVYTARFF
jgi:hypothetical protein